MDGGVSGGGRLRGGAVTTPGLIVRALGLIGLLAVLAGGLSLWASLSAQHAAVTIGRTAEPLVALALRMAESLAEMDAAALGDALTEGGAATGTSLQFQQATEKLGNDIINASKTIAYDKGEEAPLQDLQRGLTMYERAVAEARYIGAGNAWTTSHRVQWASRVNRDYAGEAARTLSQVNEAKLEAVYAAYMSNSLGLGLAAFIAFAALVVVLLAVQGWLAKQTRRTVNVPLAAATVVAGLAGLWLAGTVLTEREALRQAKKDCYDSLLVLFDAKGQAAGLQGAMSLWLLDPAARPAAEARMADALRALVGAPDLTAVLQRQAAMKHALQLEADGQAREASAALSGLGGLLGKELDNITFGMAERQPASDSVMALIRTMEVVRSVQGQEARRDHVFAVADWLRTTGDGGAGSIARMQAALSETIEVNQVEFDRHDRTARRLATLMPFGALGALTLTLGLAAAGLWQRLREYR